MTTGMVLALAQVSSFALGLAGVQLTLKFLWHVYDKGGSKDLRVAARALRTLVRGVVSALRLLVRRQKCVEQLDEKDSSS